MRPHPSAISESFKNRLKRFTSITAREFQTFLWLFNNPDHLHALTFVLENLLDVLPLAEAISESQFSPNVSKRLRRLAQEIPNRSNKRLAELKIFYNNFQRALDPDLEGIFERCPVYSALGHRPADPDSWPNFRILLSQLLACYFPQKNGQPFVGTTTVEQACKAIRDLADVKNLNYLRKLPAEQVSTEVFLTRLEEIEDDLSIPTFPTLIRFFRISVGQKKTPVASDKPAVPVDDEDDTEGTEPTEEISPTAPGVRGNKRRRKKSNRFELEKSRWRARGKRNAIAKRNARLSIDNTEVSLNDLVLLLDILSSTDTYLPDNGDIETKVLLSTILWTGKPIQKVVDFTLTQSKPLYVGRTQAYLYWGEDEKYWHIPSPGPAIQPPTAEFSHQYCRAVKDIRIPLTLHTLSMFEEHIQNRLQSPQASTKLFSLNASEAKSAAQKFLNALKRYHDTEITLTNLSRFLELQIERLPCSDRSQARLALGKITAQSDVDDATEDLENIDENLQRSTVELHYSCFTVASLQEKYTTAATHLESLWLRDNPPAVKFQPSREEQETYLGTPFRPRRKIIQTLIERLKIQVDTDYEKYRTDPSKIVHFHLTFLAYSTTMLNVATAMRAVRDCALPWNHINIQTSFAVICDKNEGEYGSCRRVWLPPFVIDQLNHLEQHMNILYNETAQLSPSLIEKFGLHRPGESTRLITLTDTLNAHLLTPKNLQALVYSITGINLRGNWTRPYLRSNLIEAGCPVESVNALLGHADSGQNPWTKTSALNPADYQETLSNYLTELMIEDGWIDLPGLWREY